MEIKYKKQEGQEIGLLKLDNGYNLRGNRKLIMRPYQIADMHTGIYIKIPEGYKLEALSITRILKETGIDIVGDNTFDENFDGELVITIKNTKSSMFVIEEGMPISKLVATKVEYATLTDGKKAKAEEPKEEVKEEQKTITEKK